MSSVPISNTSDRPLPVSWLSGRGKPRIRQGGFGRLLRVEATLSPPVSAASPPVTAGRRRWAAGTRRLVLGLGGAWLVFVTLHLILSGRTYLWGPFDLLPPIVFAAVPAVLLAIAALTRSLRWRLGLVSVTALALGIGCSGLNVA